jgi:predicted  nucleic acid-binding Zn-ribbon protein
MSIAEQMKNLSDDIVSSYKQRAAEFQQRLKDNAEINKKVQETLDGFRNDHLETAASLRANADSLRANLAKGQKERLNSFKQMMSGIHGSISQIQDEVKGIKISTASMLTNFSTDHDTVAAELHKELDQNQADRLNWNSGRLKDFKDLMLGTNKEINNIKEEVQNIFIYTDKLLTKFSDDRIKMSASMRAELKKNFTDRVTYTQNILGQFTKSLAETRKENQKMAKALKLDLQNSKEELSNSDAQRLKDFNVSFDGIQKRVHEIQKYVDTFLTEFSTDRKQAAETWSQLAAVISSLGELPEQETKKPVQEAKKPVTEFVKPEVKKVEVQKEVIFETEIVSKADVKTAEPIAKEPTAKEPIAKDPKIDTSKKEFTLEEKVLKYLNAHKKGVKVSDMEKPFGETRMRIGFVSKKLLDEGKVRKIENLYYPLTKK